MALESSNTIPSLECVPTRTTGSFLHEDAIGREREIDELVGQLVYQFDECSLNDEQNYRTEVHTIVGVGGIGKTTLAQLIYNNKQIANTFDLRMWVCVSNNFDKTRLIQEIIACTADGENAELANFSFSMLQEKLKRRLSHKRFLLVLDDVWYDEKYGDHINKEVWMEILAPIRRTMTGSKILVTTRKELVAKMLDSRSSFFLEGLGRDDSWLLFRRCAFGSRKPEDYPELKRIGDQIVQKLKGSALALKVIGGHLNDKYNDADWEDVLHKDVLNPNDILTILRLSYESLPEHLQHCFAYCSLLPKDYRIDPDRLIRMWIAQGFVHLEGNTSSSLEDIGRGYFNDLLARSFFQVICCGDETYYVMHDSMNDLALHISHGECCRVDHNSMVVLPHNIRHISVSAEQLENLLNNSDLRRLRTFIVLNKSWFCSKVCLSHDILKELKSVRVLDVSGCCLDSLPEAVNDMIHLRYLAIQRTNNPLPASISRMNHLQTLFVQYHSCYSYRISGTKKRKHLNHSRGDVIRHGGHFSLPESISGLINLAYINVEKGYTVNLSGLHQLTCMVGSGEFLVDKEDQSLVQLKDLNNIWGELAIRSLENIKNREEAAKAQLSLKEHITKLELQWGSCENFHDIGKGFEVLDVLKPHCNLDELTISGYPGVRSPSWLESGWLRRLEFICLRDCNMWVVLPPLGDLRLLRILEIRRMEELKTFGSNPGFFGHSGFPSLEVLLLERLPKLRWSFGENDQVFCNLRHLSVSGCPQLREYPTFPRKLRHIAILDKEYLWMKYCVDSLKLSRSFCHIVSSYFHVLRSHHLEFIEKMEIYVNHSVDMSSTVFHNLKSLKKLKIYGIDQASTCSVITTLLGENGCPMLPLSLKHLELVQCYLHPFSLSKLLNNLPSLSTISLADCDTVEMPGPPVSLHKLRMLKRLDIFKCYSISSFEGSEALTSLEEMKINQCHHLESVPYLDDMPCLKKLHLYSCPQVMELAGHQTALKELFVGSCDGLSSLQKLCDLVSLVVLSVTDCPNLLWLPDMDGFYSLRDLKIGQCPRLISLPRSGLPVSLKTIFLSGCHQALEEQFQQKEGPDWNKVAALPGCKLQTNRW